jgi:hypothetical protein
VGEAASRRGAGLSEVFPVVALFRFGMKNFFYVTSDVSKGCRERFLETNKKTNYIARQETARQIY